MRVGFEKAIFMSSTLAAVALATMLVSAGTTAWAASVFDGFGDADRNNNSAITPFDTDVDLSGAIDGSEISAPEDASDVGIHWVGTNGFTSSNTGDPKANIKVIDDSAGLGSGYALGVEAKGSGSSFVGFFSNSIDLGPNLGDKVVVSVDFRIWTASNNPTPPPAAGELRWGLFQDTDNEFGSSNNEGLDSGGGQASVIWGPDSGENDGSWKDAGPGPEGDKGIWSRVQIGVLADEAAGRINYEYNLAGINGTSNNGRFLEGSGTRNEPGSGGDVATVASPTSDGPGLKIGGDLGSDPTNQIPVAPHSLRMEIVRGVDGPIIRSFVDGALGLEDDITSGLTGAAFMLPAPESFDFVAFRNTGSNGDFDYIIDNFSVASVPIPEPTALALLGVGAALAVVCRRRG